MSKLAATSLKKIRSAPQEQQKTYAKALKASLTWDRDKDHQKPDSPDQVASDYGIPVPTLVELGIVVDREGAVAFLNDLPFRTTLPSFAKLCTTESFSEKLGRPIGKLGNRHIFTFGELLFFVQYTTPLELPAELSSMLRR